MAYGDLPGLRELAFDYFNDTRRLMTGWQSLLDSKNYSQIRDDLHRCKGGASLFGLERLFEFLGVSEVPAALEDHGFDFVTFERELIAAEEAVTRLTE